MGLRIYTSESIYDAMPDRVADEDNSIAIAKRLYDNSNGLLPDRTIFTCPAVGNSKNYELSCDYILFPPSETSDQPNTIVAADKPGNHDDGANLLFMDMHIRYCKYPGNNVKIYAAWTKAFAAGKEGAALLGPQEWARKQGLLK